MKPGPGAHSPEKVYSVCLCVQSNLLVQVHASLSMPLEALFLNINYCSQNLFLIAE